MDEAVMRDWARRWPNFTPDEMRCRGTGKLDMNPAFMDRLQGLRNAFGAPLVITSGYRDPVYNSTVSKTGLMGPHTTGRAVDIAIYGEAAVRLLRQALNLGFTGFGFLQHGPTARRFIHLDDIPPGGHHPRPWPWTY